MIGEEAECREQGKEQVWKVRPELDHLTQVKSLNLIWSKPWKNLSEKDERMPYGMNWQLDSNSVL